MATPFAAAVAPPPPRRQQLWLRQLMRKWGGLSNTGSSSFSHDLDFVVLDSDHTPFDFPKELEELQFKLEELEKQEQRVHLGSFHSTGLQRGATNNSLVRGQSETLRQQFIDHHQYRVAVHTWNVAGKPPPEDLDMEGWINNSSLPADIYVFGFQEVVPLNANNVLCVEDEGPAALWEAKIRETLNILPTQCTVLEKSLSVPLSPHRHSSNGNGDVLVTDVPEVSDVEKLLAELSNNTDKLLLGSARYNQFEDLVAWKSTANEAAGPLYSRVASKQMVGLFITVWIRSPLWRHVHNVQVSTVGCGLMNHLGNKGSIAVSMFLHYTSFCFVCSHLTSGHKDGDALRRNADVAEILRRTKFPRLAKLLGLGLPETILAHERVIWLGDLNYRLALPDKETWALVKRGDWASLLRMDQLKLEQGEGRVFPDWQEGPIYFPPTYKYMNASDQYYSGDDANPNSATSGSSSKRRSPAWCDRVLWHGEGLQQLDYVREESKLSDHRCVSATFMAEVEVVSQKKLKKACVVPVNHDDLDVHSKVVPMVKPLVHVHKLHSNEVWSSLLKKLTPGRQKSLEIKMDSSRSDLKRLLDQPIWFDANEGEGV